MRLAPLSPIDAVGMQNPSEPFMRGANIYSTDNGWIYEVWFQGRVVVVGCCLTFEAAMRAVATV
jgi:hypothetical protein